MTIEKLRELINVENETEIVEFKENWLDKEKLGEYISALSNAAAYYHFNEAYMIWGVTNKPHKIVGTKFNYDKDYDGEPLKNYLARNLNPSVTFNFEELFIDDKRVVVLIVPAAKDVITEFNKERYIRIGSSKKC